MEKNDNSMNRSELFHQAFEDYKMIMRYLMEKGDEDDLFYESISFVSGITAALSNIQLHLNNDSEWYYKKQVDEFYHMIFMFYTNVFSIPKNDFSPEFTALIRGIYFKYRNNEIRTTDFGNPELEFISSNVIKRSYEK